MKTLRIIDKVKSIAITIIFDYELMYVYSKLGCITYSCEHITAHNANYISCYNNQGHFVHIHGDWGSNMIIMDSNNISLRIRTSTFNKIIFQINKLKHVERR